MIQSRRGLAQQGQDFGAVGGIAAGDQHTVAASGEAQGDGPADSAGAAGDQ